MTKYTNKFNEKGNTKPWMKCLTDSFALKMTDIKNRLLNILDKLRYQSYNNDDDDDSPERKKIFSANHRKFSRSL